MYIYNYGRTVIGKQFSKLSKMSPLEITSTLLEKTKMTQVKDLDFISVGITRSAGNGPSFARQVAVKNGYDTVESTSYNSACMTGMYAMLDSLRRGGVNLSLCVGVDSMSQAPELKLKDGRSVDHNIQDGLHCPVAAATPLQQVVNLNKKYPKSRAELDAYALRSHQRSQHGWDSGFYDYVTPVEGLVRDETVRGAASIESFAKAPVLDGEGHIACSNVTSRSDGASFALVGHLPFATLKDGTIMKPKARVVDFVMGYGEPHETVMASIPAIESLLKRNKLTLKDIDVVELSDPFAWIALEYMNRMELDERKLNMFGGTLSLGHPVASTGLRLVQNAVGALERVQGRYAIASTPAMIGVGVAALIERL
eukprot:GILJ01005382.1.p1 GENE.GILJ01005382.1~~GILJ01005382.1.p1  ORF type:complete len:398 (-),score=77.34 GILJ01005382.1:168-1271(-)